MSINNAYSNLCRPQQLYSNRWLNEQVEQPTEWGLPQIIQAQNLRWQLPNYFTPTARRIIDEVSAATQSSPIMVSTMFLGATAAAVHTSYDVQPPNRPPTPTSLFCLTIKKSGGKKTTVLNVLLTAHFAFQRAAYQEQADDAELQANCLIWNAKIKASEALARKHAEDDEMLRVIASDLASIIRKKPKKKRLATNIVMKDTTKQALSFSAFEDSPSLTLISDEATSFFKTFVNDLTTFNQGYDGSDIKVDRKTSLSFFVHQPRVGLILATQPKPFQKTIDEKGLELIEIGTLPRTLVSSCNEDKNMQINPHLISNEARKSYFSDIHRLLHSHNEKLKASDFSRTVLRFTPEAEDQWERTRTWLHDAAMTNGSLSNIQEYAARCPEHIARVAANLHVIENNNGTDISLETILSATLIVRWYATEFQDLFGDMSMPEHERDAKSISKFLWARFQLTGIAQQSLRCLGQYTWGGRELRSSSSRILAAVEYLESRQIVFRAFVGKRCDVFLDQRFINSQLSQPSGLFRYDR